MKRNNLVYCSYISSLSNPIAHCLHFIRKC